MPTPTKGRRMGGSAAHQQHMLENLATALFEHGKITTTQARARRLRPVAERLITFAKRGDLHARRQVLTMVTDKSVVKTLFDEIGPSFASRPGGYTRITKIGMRKGDSAAMAVIELVREESAVRPQRRRARRAQPARQGRAGQAGAAEAGVAEAGVAEAGVAEAGAAAEPAAPEVSEVEVSEVESATAETESTAADPETAAPETAAADEEGAADEDADAGK